MKPNLNSNDGVFIGCQCVGDGLTSTRLGVDRLGFACKTRKFA